MSRMDVVDYYNLEHSAVVSCKSGSMKLLQHFYIFKRKIIRIQTCALNRLALLILNVNYHMLCPFTPLIYLVHVQILSND